MSEKNAEIVQGWLQNNDSEIAQAVNDLLVHYQGKAQWLEGKIRNDYVKRSLMKHPSQQLVNVVKELMKEGMSEIEAKTEVVRRQELIE